MREGRHPVVHNDVRTVAFWLMRGAVACDAPVAGGPAGARSLQRRVGTNMRRVGIACVAMLGLVFGGAVAAGDLSQRAAYLEANGLPAAYEAVAAPGEVDHAAGEALYGTHCAECHGDGGLGNGASGAYFSPRPTNLTESLKAPGLTDGYLLWTIKEGGQPVGTGMPAFDEEMGEAEMLTLIAYLRARWGG